MPKFFQMMVEASVSFEASETTSFAAFQLKLPMFIGNRFETKRYEDVRMTTNTRTTTMTVPMIFCSIGILLSFPPQHKTGTKDTKNCNTNSLD